jgi:hypothetical protein
LFIEIIAGSYNISRNCCKRNNKEVHIKNRKCFKKEDNRKEMDYACGGALRSLEWRHISRGFRKVISFL